MVKRRVELFASNELEYLEAQMNGWLDTNLDCDVIDVRFAGQGTSIDAEPYFDIIYTAIIFYEKSE